MTLAELLALLGSMGSDPSEETAGLSELDHGLQCAFELARGRPDDQELQVAGLVHDIGHRFGADDRHGVLGAEEVRGVLGDRVAGLVEAHVPAKRYLVTADSDYQARLSAQSTLTLEVQGGTLTPDEVRRFLSSPYASDAVELRRADDAAKVPGRAVPPLEHWVPVLEDLVRSQPRAGSLGGARFPCRVDVTSGSPVRRSVVVGGDLEALRDWATEVEAWPAGSHRWGQYAEQTAMGQSICRTENVSACHPGIAGLVGGVLADVASSALGVEVVGFKDKINYKQPGGAGFSPHQDLAAYPGVSRVMSILVAIDECTTASGCIWFASGVDELLRTDDRGVVVPEVVESLWWTPAELAPGDALCIAGLTPHYSQANKSSAARRVLVASYAATADDYDREGYYSAREQEMARAAARDDQFRISTLGDFEGTQVPNEASGPVDACRHR